MFRSLRSILILPWLFVAFVCCALTFQLLGLMELGIGGEIGKAKNSAKDSAERIKQDPTHDSVKRDVPKDEADRIVTLNKRALSTKKEETALCPCRFRTRSKP